MLTENPNTPSPWRQHALALARFAQAHFVNRTDVWGGYCPTGAITCPAVARRGRERLTLNCLINHFAGRRIVGLHAIALDNTCLWAGFDIDAHGDAADPAENWRVTLRLVDALLAAGLEPLIEDSNGAGGFHVWIIFSRPIPSELAYRLCRWIRRQAGADDVETFPKQPGLDESRRFGNWLRLPGKHHKRDHWSRFWDQDSEQWLSGEDAVQHLLSAPVNDPDILIDLLPVLPKLPKSEPTPLRITHGAAQPNAIPLPVIPDAAQPVCVTDILANSIRKPQTRDRGLMTLARYWRAAGVNQDEAIRRGVDWTTRIPRHLTSAAIEDAGFVQQWVASVVGHIYGGAHPWHCRFAWNLGSDSEPIQCNGRECSFVQPQGVRTKTLTDSSIKTRSISEAAVRTYLPEPCRA